MTKFNPENREHPTIGDLLDPAMEITDQKDAYQYLTAYVAYITKEKGKDPRKSTKSSLEIAKENLGYYAGYFGDEVRARVEKLFNCEHPVFGSIEKNGPPTTEEAFTAGFEAGKRLRK